MQKDLARFLEEAKIDSQLAFNTLLEVCSKLPAGMAIAGVDGKAKWCNDEWRSLFPVAGLNVEHESIVQYSNVKRIDFSNDYHVLLADQSVIVGALAVKTVHDVNNTLAILFGVAERLESQLASNDLPARDILQATVTKLLSVIERVNGEIQVLKEITLAYPVK
jgi:hypothetical protein